MSPSQVRDQVVDEPRKPLNEQERQHLLSESARLRAQARKQYEVRCYECNKDLVGLARRKFCGQTCQRRSWRRRLAAMGPGDELPPPEAGRP